MANKKILTREGRRARRHLRVRKKVSGTAERPRLVVYRSLNNVEGQLVDDVQRRDAGIGISTMAAALRERPAARASPRRTAPAPLGKRWPSRPAS
jgi:large subunit ribosomal protein L18